MNSGPACTIADDEVLRKPQSGFGRSRKLPPAAAEASGDDASRRIIIVPDCCNAHSASEVGQSHVMSSERKRRPLLTQHQTYRCTALSDEKGQQLPSLGQIRSA